MNARSVNKRKNKIETHIIIRTAMMMCLTMVMTWVIRIPVPATEGYIHLGDCMVFMAVLLLGWKWGAIAAGVGSALADIIGGFAMFAPITLVVKILMALAVGGFIEQAMKRNYGKKGIRAMMVIGMVIGGVVMMGGYYLAECLLYGNWVVPLAEIPMNIVQFVVGAALATLLSNMLYKTPAGNRFAYNLNGADSKNTKAVNQDNS